MSGTGGAAGGPGPGGYDPWASAAVWFCEDKDSIWLSGVVKSYVVLDKTKHEWKFTIEKQVLKEKEEGEEQGEDEFTTELVDITSVAVDSFNLEFMAVKKRDKNPGHMIKISDMTSLAFLNEPEMIECLRQRFKNEIIYTSIGPILVAVNPFKQLGESVYSNEAIAKYFNCDQNQSKALGPHTYGIAHGAYMRMFIDKFDPDKRENQSILVNGESGAGKTESTKQVLRFLGVNSTTLAASLDNSSVRDIDKLVNSVNPITESFGNAKTSRNNNSSRFGKFIELNYTADGYIGGAFIQTYLLETIRVTSQLKGERNYHIFYEIFASLNAEQREKYDCPSMDCFRYLNQSGEYNRHDGEDDLKNFEKLCLAMDTINMDSEQIESVIRIVLAILHIGNLTFDLSTTIGEDAAVFSEESKIHVKSVCTLLGIEELFLLNAVAKRSIRVAGNSIQKNLNVEGAIAARDVYAKTTYDLLFRSMLREFNKSLSLSNSDNDETVSFIGVLDIFGFEYFAKNSFEQLCINYANEKLQDHFNYAIFKSEKEVYEDEGIKWSFTDYPDNSERLELFEHRTTGLFLLCDEQLKIPKPSDDKLAKSFYAKCQSHRYFLANRSEQVRMEFVVCHFACDVRYEAAGFVEKNRNEIGQEIFDSYENSQDELMQQLPSLSDHHSAKKTSDHVGETPKKNNFSSVHVKKKTSSLASQFSKQLSDLILKIRSTRSHFIRCIKPNNSLESDVFDLDMVMNQLRCGGALGAVQVFHAGFPNRMDFQFFVSKYSAFLVICGRNALTKDLEECIERARRTGADDLWRSSASMLIDIVSLTMIVLNLVDESEIAQEVDVLSGLQMGLTQVFMRAPVFEYLERLHARTIILIAKRLQRRCRQQALAKMPNATAKLAAANCVILFAHGRRGKARSCVSATLLLQRRVRVFLATRWRVVTIRRFTRLKAHFRGYKARAQVRAMKFRAAAKMQKVFRCYKAQKDYKQLRKTAIYVQAVVRGYLAWNTKMKKLKLILTLQCLWRGTLARIETFVYRQKLKQQALETQKRAQEAKANFMTNLDDKLKSNPNLLFDMLGASDKIALLSRQNEALMQSNQLLESENADLREKLASSVDRSVLEEMELNQQLQLQEELQKQQDMFESGGYIQVSSPNATPMTSPQTSSTVPELNDKDVHGINVATERMIDVTISSDDHEVPTSSSTTATDLETPVTTTEDTLPTVPFTPVRTRTLSGVGSAFFTATPSAGPIDYHQRILSLAKEGVRKLGYIYDKKNEGRDELMNDVGELSEEIQSLKSSLSKLQTKHTEESERVHHLKKEQEFRVADRRRAEQTPPPSPSQQASSVSPASSSDPKAQLAYLNLQLQTLRKRKVTTESLIATLEADKDQYSLDDIQATQTMLSGISTKIEELERQQEVILKSSPAKLPQKTPPPPPMSSQQQSPQTQTGFSASFASVSGLASSVANVTGLANSVRMKLSSSAPTPSPNSKSSEPHRPYFNAKDIDAKCEACDSRIAHMDQEIRILKETLNTKAEKLKDIEEELSLYEIDETNAAELRKMKEIVLFLTDEGGSKSTLVPEVDAQWKVKDLMKENAALSDELRKVKGRFSSVLGTMDNFSLSNFRVNQVGGGESESSTDSKSSTVKSEPNREQTGGKRMSVTAPLSIQAAKQQELARIAKNWSPNFIGSVNTWSRQGRECIFIISVRAVGEGVSEWTVMKNFNEFKALRNDLKTYSAAIDSSFPGDYFSFFSLSDEAAEDRMEALNTYLLSVCGCQNIMTSEQGCISVKNFLRIDENMGKKRR